MKFKTVAIALTTLYAVAITGVLVAANVPANASPRQVITVRTGVSDRQVFDLLTRYVNGHDARRSDLKVVRFVLDSTVSRARTYPCGFGADGNLLSAKGDLHEAQLIGEVENAPSAKEKDVAEKKFARHMGFCYLANEATAAPGSKQYTSSMRAGAVKRIALALSKMSGDAVAIQDGRKVTTYVW